MPLPVRLMLLTVAAFWALLVRLICAVLAPVVVGVKLRVRLQVPEAAMLVQPLWPLRVKLVALVPVSVMSLILRVAVPVLLIVTVRLLLALLMIWSPKLTGLLRLMTGTGIGVPVPVRVTVCGLPAALSVMLTRPLTVPILVAVNTTPIWQLLPGASELAQSGGVAVGLTVVRLNGVATAMLLRMRLAKPVLVMVMNWLALVVLRVCAPKVSAAGAMAMPGTALAEPVPVRAMVCGEPGALLTTLMLPLRAATVSGVKVMLMAQVPPALIGGVAIGQVLVNPKSPLLVMLLMVRLAVPLLVSVTTVAGLVVLTVRLPKFTVDGARVTAGDATAVTVSIALLPTALLPVDALKPPAGKVNVYPPVVALLTLTPIAQVPIGEITKPPALSVVLPATEVTEPPQVLVIVGTVAVTTPAG